jgi:malate dehydrogenase (oxaloacetate-decarboxylating)
MNYGERSIKIREKKNVLKIVPNVKLETKNDLSTFYTPGIAAVSKEIAENKKKIFDLTIKRNTVAVVSDGSAVLGLGNIGPERALPVMEGKSLLFSEFAGIDAFPICLATQDAQEIIQSVKNLSLIHISEPTRPY